jgi:hypothetical protein
MSRKSLAADIDELLNVAPRDYDPEDEPGYDAVARSSSYAEEGADGDDDALVDVPDGRLRLKGGLHDTFDPEDPRSAYAGRRASRRDLDSDSDSEEEEEEEDSDEGEDDDASEEEDAEGGGEQSEGSEDAGSSSEGDQDSAGEDGSDDDDDDDDEENAPELLSSSFAKARRGGSASGGSAVGGGAEPDDATRGTHIKTQKRLWDSLLQLRMRLQPAMESARQLPRPSMQMVLRSAAADAAATAAKQQKKASAGKKRKAAEQVAQRLGGAVEALQSVENELCGLLGDLGDLQQALVDNNGDISESAAKRRRVSQPPPPASGSATSTGDGADDSNSDTDADAGSEDGAKQSGAARRGEWEYLSWEHGLLEPYALHTIDRWGRRVQNKAMGLGLGKGVAFKTLNKPVSAQVDELMQSSRERLLQRTRLKRTQYRVLGTAKAGTAADGSERRDEAALEEAAELGLQPSTHEYDEEVYVSQSHPVSYRLSLSFDLRCLVAAVF